MQSLDRDRLEIVLTLQSDVFRLCEKLPSRPHSHDHSRPNQYIGVSRGAKHCHVPRQRPLALKSNQRETIWSPAVLAYQPKLRILKLFDNWDSSSYESSSNEIVQRAMSGTSLGGLPVNKGTTASIDRRAASAKVRDTHSHPAQDVNRLLHCLPCRRVSTQTASLRCGAR